MATRPPELYGRPIREIARLCGVSLKTAARWKAGQTVPPPTALQVMSGDLGMFDPAWSGWCVRGEELVSPEGWRIQVHDVRATPLLRAQVSVYQSENRKLRRELEGPQIEDQPEPGNWSISTG